MWAHAVAGAARANVENRRRFPGPPPLNSNRSQRRKLSGFLQLLSSLVANASPMPVRLAPPTRASVFQPYSATQHFHRVSADSNVGDTLAVSRCSHIHFARTTNLDALSNQYLFVAVCDPVLHHPTRGATGRCSRRWIFTAIKEHARPGFQPAFVPLRTDKVRKLGFGVLEKFCCLRIREV